MVKSLKKFNLFGKNFNFGLKFFKNVNMECNPKIVPSLVMLLNESHAASGSAFLAKSS